MNRIAEKYHNIYHETTLEETKNSFKYLKDNILDDNDMTVIFTRLQDSTFMELINKPKLLTNTDFMIRCYLEKGKHIHLIKAFGKGYSGFKNILIKLINKYNPKTLTWFRDDLKLHRINLKRRILCHG